MPVTLPTDGDGKLVPYDASAISLMNFRRRGVSGEGDHVSYNFSPEGSGCTRRFSVAWDHRFKAVIHLAGAATSYIDPGSGVRKLSRLIPQRDGDFPNWVCTKAELMPWRFVENLREPVDEESIEDANPGFSKGVHMPVFTRAEIRATYELVPFDVCADSELDPTLKEQTRYVTWPGYPGADVSAEASYVGLPGGIVWFATSDGTIANGPAGTPIPHPVGFVEMGGRISCVWRRLPLSIWGPTSALFLRLIGTATTRGYIGALNKTAWRGYPELTLQLIGIEQRLLPDANGLGYSWDLRYIMAQKVAPWGHLGIYFADTKPTGAQNGYYQVLRPAAGKTTKTATALGDNDSIFHVREFADLFTPGV